MLLRAHSRDVCLCGIGLETSELLTGTRGAQIAGRFTLVPTRPFQVAPRLGEGTDSFICRLARANHLKPSYLHGYLVGPPDYGRGKRPRADRLAAVTGRQLDALERALPDLARQTRAKPDKPKRRFTMSAEKTALFAAIRLDVQQQDWSLRQLVL